MILMACGAASGAHHCSDPWLPWRATATAAVLRAATFSLHAPPFLRWSRSCFHQSIYTRRPPELLASSGSSCIPKQAPVRARQRERHLRWRQPMQQREL